MKKNIASKILITLFFLLNNKKVYNSIDNTTVEKRFINEVSSENFVHEIASKLDISILSIINSLLTIEVTEFLKNNEKKIKIPKILFQSTQLLSLLAEASKNNFNEIGEFCINLINILDNISIKYNFIEHLNNVDTFTHDSLSGFATGSRSYWSYTINTATSSWLKKMALNIKVYIGKIAQLKSYFLLTPKECFNHNKKTLWIIDEINNNIIEISPNGTILNVISIMGDNKDSKHFVDIGSPLWFIEESDKNINDAYIFNTDASNIIIGPDDNIWIGTKENKIELCTIGGSLIQTIYTSETPLQLQKDINGTVWFAGQKYIGKITKEGFITEIPSITKSQVYLTQGVDEGLYFGDFCTKKIYRIIS